MKKSLIAAAVLSCLGSAAMAQSVTIYGIMDASVVRIDDGTDEVYRLDSGRNAASRLGFRGNEDLGGGLKAVFLLESQMNISDGTTETGQFWSRLAYVGLEGNFGGVRLGRQDSPMRTALNVIDPFMNAGMAGSIDFLAYHPTVGTTTLERVDNQVTYILPSGLGGVNGSVAWNFGESGATSNGDKLAANIGYGAGPLAAQLAYSKQNGAAAGHVTNLLLGATYDFGFLKIHGGYEKADSNNGFATPEVDVQGYLIGATVPIGDALKLRAWYIKNSVDGVANGDSQAAALSLTYALSKRTQLYTTFVQTDNDAAGTLGVLSSPNPTGEKVNALALGVQHNF